MEQKVINSSLRNVLNLTIPIVLSTMSTNLMYIIDNFMLAGYSIDAMNASAMSGNFVAMFTMIFIGTASIAEVYVGQYNGSKQYNKLASPVWQMVYLSLLSSVIFVPIAYFSDYLNTLPSYYLTEGLIYQKILMYFGAFPSVKIALAAFFIGQGKTKVVTVVIAIGVILNIVLDYLLIYGISGIIKPLGSKGAAIATVASELAQIIILTVIFLSKNNREIFKTFKNREFNKELFWSCIKTGTPISCGNFVTMLAWYVVQTAVSHVSKDAATIYNIGLNIYVFFIFVGDGLNKASAAICSNMIGCGDLASIEKTRKIFVAISLIFGFLTAIPLVIFPQWILNMFNMLPDNLSSLYSDIKTVLCLVTITVTLETLLLSTWGILLAGGDTKYSMGVYQICLWVLVVLPITLLYYLHMLDNIPMIYTFMVAWLIITQFFIYKRYKSLKWYNKLI